MNLVTLYLRLRYRRHTFGPGFRGPLRLRIRGPGRVRFANGVIIRNVSGKTALLTFTAQAVIDVGDRVEIDGAGLMAATGITVEADAILGPCLVVDTDFHAIGPARRRAGAVAEAQPIRIRSGAWVQGKSTLLKGVTVGEGAVVRWGSVVASDVAAHTVVLGNPALATGSVPGSAEV